MYCLAQPHAPPQARARGPDAPGSPADVVAFVHALQFYSLSARAVLSTGGEGLRSPSPCRSGKAPAAVAAAFLPPLVARTAKALSVGNFPQVAAAAASQASAQEQQEQAESAAAPKPVK